MYGFRLGTADMATLGRRVRELRETKRWKQSDLARRSGVSQKAISNLERGGGGRESATLSTIKYVADALSVPVWRLLLEADDLYKEDGVDQLLEQYIKSTPDGRRNIERIADMESRYHP